jgi:adenosylmethionine-8-amino-7-oxononanoate aminotransferase
MTGAVWRPYCQMKTAPPPPEVVATEGVRLILADGRVLIDGTASWWTACHGYNHPAIADAVAAQLARMPHVMFGGLTHAPAETLARLLASMLPGDLNHVFFSDSGSVAVEIALKIAVQSWINRGHAGRTRFVSFTHGYHGDTLGAMAVTDPGSGMHARLAPYLPPQFVVDLPRDAAALERFEAFLGAERDRIAGVILEPLVQGAGGMKFHSPEMLAGIEAACRRTGHWLILDEIMTGFGRTGTMFACEQAGIVPDIICLSKALTGGTMALAATVATDSVFECFLSDDPAAALMHGPTFMANPLACAAANASLDLFLKEDRLAQIGTIEAGLRAGLAKCRDLEGVVEVRVMGAIGVVQLAEPVDTPALRQDLLEQGVWVRPFGDIVYLTPAFTIASADLAALCEAVFAVLAARAREWRPQPGRRGSSPDP